MEPICIATIEGTGATIVFGPAEEGGGSVGVNGVKHSSQRIHPDDTMETIKRKLLVELPSVSYDELYLYASVHPFLTVERTVHLLTCGHRFPISRDRLATLCQNLKSPHVAEKLCATLSASDADNYTADELTEFLLAIQHSEEDLRMDVPLGESLQYDYPLPANPFQKTLDPFLNKAHPDLVKTNNKTVLLEYGIVQEPVMQIHVCCAGDVLTGADDDAVKIKLYYPYLHEKGIASREQLAERRQELLDETRQHVDAAFVKHNDAVDVLHRVHNERQNPAELRYAERGIKSVHFIMHPVTRFVMPLDSLFKVLHSAQQTPLIKYNPQGQREKVYRLYAPGVAKNGRRIPALTKAKIVRLDGEIGKRRRVAAYMEHRLDNGFACEVVCEFDAEANAHVKAHFRRAVPYGDAENDYDNAINRVLRACLNPLLDEARRFLQSTSGNSIDQFCSIAVPTVEIADIVWSAHLMDTPMLRAQGIMGCVSAVFAVIDETDGELSMRYKRVSNYDERFGAEAYIAERMRKEATVGSIVSGLVKNRLVKTEEAAMQRVADYRLAEQVMEGAHRRSRTRIKQPGFLTVVRRENTELHVEISDITSARYIRLLEIYVDAILRISMCEKGKRTTRVPMPVLETLCSKSSGRKVTEVQELHETNEGGDVPAFVADLSFEDRIALERALEREAEGLDALEDPADVSEADVLSMMDMMMEPEGESEEEEEEEEEGDDSDQEGGAPKKAAAAAAAAAAAVMSGSEDEDESVSETETESGAYAPQSLKNPNPFEQKLQRSEPILFLSKKTGNYDTYSTNCQSNIKRQPVVLSKQEYDELHADPTMRPLLKDALEYGSDPDNKYYYMCPRYWSFKDRRPMTEQEVKDKHLERHVIGKKDKDVTLDKYIFEFNDYGKEHMGAKGYIPHYPGFLNASVHPDGLCVPCCFKKQQRFADLNVCEDKLRAAKAPAQTVPAPAPAEAAVQPPPKDDYIVGPDKFPIPLGRRGYLPQPVQRFLNYDNSTCQVSQTNKTLKKNAACLLRHGVQEWNQDTMGRLSELQSFIACMAAMRQDEHPKSIIEMKKIMLDGITLDSFLTYQNGTLIDAFKPAPGQEREVNGPGSTHRDSNYVKKMTASMKGKDAAQQRAAMSNTINAYENFRRFIESNDTVIDHTYLWDIFTTFNPKIFNTQQQRLEHALKHAQEKGVANSKELAIRNIGFNLIILEIPKDDNSDALNIVCPSNHYSNNQFNAHKPTVILIKQYNYYEPIYQFTDNDNAKKSDIKKSFSLNEATLLPNLKVMIDLIRLQIMPACAPVKVPTVKPYTFKYNISAEEAISILKKEKFTVNRLVLNYDSKVIGLEVAKMRANGIIMTAASPLDPSMADIDMDLVMMDDLSIWSSYEDTLRFLAFVSKETKARIPCLPRINVVDDGRLIGIMTETNQFMEIQPHIPVLDIPPVPAGVKSLDLIAYNTTNPNVADAEVQTGSNEDAKRVKYVRRIRLETEMYALFRNSMRIMINKIKNMERKKRLEGILHAPNDGTHPDKLREIMRICREMGDPSIQFTQMSDAVLDAFKTDSVAFMQCLSAESRMEYGPNTCMRMREVNAAANECTILLPRANLVNGMDNRTFYYGKLADELLRYTRIRRFILSSASSFSSLAPMPYDAHPHEIILLHSQLEPYFDHLEPGAGSMNPFARYNAFATANPELNPGETPSSNYVGAAPSGGNVCAPVELKPLAGAATHYFPPTMQLLAFDNAGGECTFEAFIAIMREERAEYEDVSVRELKDILVDKYDELARTHKVQLMNYYKHLTANRRVLATNVQDFIMNSFHYMTHLDLWILAQRFKIPVVLFAGHMKYPLLENQQPALVLYHAHDPDETNAAFYYVMTSGRARDVAPGYSIVRTAANVMKFPLSQCTNAAIASEIMKQLVVGVGSVSQCIAEYVPVVKKRVLKEKEKDADDES